MFNYYSIIDEEARCTVPLNNPDIEGGHRTRDLTELLVDQLEIGVLWDEYSLVGDIVISDFLLFFNSPSRLVSTIGLVCLFQMVDTRTLHSFV